MSNLNPPVEALELVARYATGLADGLAEFTHQPLALGAIVINLRWLEECLNPGRLTFDHPGRRLPKSISGWPDALRLMPALATVRDVADEVIRALGVKGICEGHAVGCVSPKRALATISSDTVERLRAAAGKVTEIVEAVRPPPPSIRRSRKKIRRKRTKRKMPTVDMMKAYELRKAGSTYRKIGKALKRSPETARQWVILASDWTHDKAKSVRAKSKLPTDRRGQPTV